MPPVSPHEAARYINDRPLFCSHPHPIGPIPDCPRMGGSYSFSRANTPRHPSSFLWQLTLSGYVIVGLRSANPTYTPWQVVVNIPPYTNAGDFIGQGGSKGFYEISSWGSPKNDPRPENSGWRAEGWYCQAHERARVRSLRNRAMAQQQYLPRCLCRADGRWLMGCSRLSEKIKERHFDAQTR